MWCDALWWCGVVYIYCMLLIRLCMFTLFSVYTYIIHVCPPFDPLYIANAAKYCSMCEKSMSAQIVVCSILD